MRGSGRHPKPCVPDLRLIEPIDRTYVEVEIDGKWHGGILHAWNRATLTGRRWPPCT